MLEIKIFFIDYTAISFRAIIEIFGIQLCFVPRKFISPSDVSITTDISPGKY